MNSLNLLKYKFTLRFTGYAVLPPFMGNTIRGAFGQSLCDNFPDAYERVFKTEAARSVPNPFTVFVPYPGQGGYAAGGTLDFTLTLFGSACNYENDAVTAVKLMCRGKLAKSEIVSAKRVYAREWSDKGIQSIPYTDVLTLRFLTPAEIPAGGEPIAALSFTGFIDSLFGRISGIIDNHSDGEFAVPYSLIAAKPYVKADCKIKPVRFRTSGQPVNGFTGTIRYFGDVTRYMPYIDLGSQLHIGKKTTRSCGAYSFEV